MSQVIQYMSCQATLTLLHVSISTLKQHSCYHAVFQTSPLPWLFTICSNSALCDILYKRLRNTLTYLRYLLRDAAREEMAEHLFYCAQNEQQNICVISVTAINIKARDLRIGHFRSNRIQNQIGHIYLLTRSTIVWRNTNRIGPSLSNQIKSERPIRIKSRSFGGP